MQVSNYTDRNVGSAFITKIAYGDGTFIAFNYDQGMRTSTDNGITWNTRSTSYVTSRVDSAIYGNGLWIIKSASKSLLISTDTITWASTNVDTDIGTVIAYGNGKFVSSSLYGFKTSTDAINWITQVSNVTGPTGASAIEYGNGIWVAVGSLIRTSTDDGVTWNTQNANYTTSFQSLAYGNGSFVAGGITGAIRTSTNGINWNTQTSIPGGVWTFHSWFYVNNATGLSVSLMRSRRRFSHSFQPSSKSHLHRDIASQVVRYWA